MDESLNSALSVATLPPLPCVISPSRLTTACITLQQSANWKISEYPTGEQIQFLPAIRCKKAPSGQQTQVAVV